MRLRIGAFEHIDNGSSFTSIKDIGDLEELLGDGSHLLGADKAEALKPIVADLFKRAGWEGDGEINLIWVPPFFFRYHDTWGEYIWHVKQSNNGTSFLGVPPEGELASLRFPDVEWCGTFDSEKPKYYQKKGNGPRAIQTEYDGYKFRSRREARWAVFLDSCGARWEYEPEGFELENGLRYLPDFLVHDVLFIHGFEGDRSFKDLEKRDLWIEVKTDKPTERDKKKVEVFSEDNPMIVVGGIPDGENINSLTDIMGFIESEKNGLDFYNFIYVDGDYFSAYPGITKDGDFALFGADGTYLAYCDEAKTVNAYKAARQARFEYGEQPKVANGF